MKGTVLVQIKNEIVSLATFHYLTLWRITEGQIADVATRPMDPCHGPNVLDATRPFRASRMLLWGRGLGRGVNVDRQRPKILRCSRFTAKEVNDLASIACNAA
jgi:hypothetical protein